MYKLNKEKHNLYTCLSYHMLFVIVYSHTNLFISTNTIYILYVITLLCHLKYLALCLRLSLFMAITSP